MATLELHVWGPAFGLPSIDAECIAAIAYFSSTLDPSDYELVQSSPSAVPTQHLPALYDPSTDTWAAGFSVIVTHLEAHVAPKSYRSPTSAQTSASQRADAVAYSAYLATHAAPLLALSLYVSSANWAAATRPAYSQILPFPLTWTEPSVMRAAMARRAEHLGLSGLDADATAAQETAAQEAAASAGWAQVPASLRRSGGPRTALNPEQAARIRLDGLAADLLDVLSGAEELCPRSDENAGGSSSGDSEDATIEKQGTTTTKTQTPFRCLAFGYLALMLVPDVPRPWLREALCAPRYARLRAFVEDFRREYDAAWRALPRRTRRGPQDSTLAVGARFAQGAVHDVPVVSEVLRRWWWAVATSNRSQEQVRSTSSTSSASRKAVSRGSVGFLDRHQFLLATGVGLSCCWVAAASAWLYRSWPLGAPIQRFEMPRVELRSLGAAGAMFARV